MAYIQGPRRASEEALRQPAGTIFPVSGDIGRCIRVVSGTARYIPKDQHVWLIVSPDLTEKPRYFPQDGARTDDGQRLAGQGYLRPNDLGHWRAYNVILGARELARPGGVSISREPFTLLLYRADSKAAKPLNDYIAAHSDGGLGMDEVPEGATLLDGLTVERVGSETCQ